MMIVEHSVPETATVLNRIPFDYNVFSRAREIELQNRHVWIPCRFPGAVEDFYLRWERDDIIGGDKDEEWKKHVFTNYSGGSLRPVADSLDITFISRYDAYYFEELEEYSWAIADLIMYLWPKKQVWFQDHKASMFWSEEEIHCGTIEEFRRTEASIRALHIRADKHCGWPEYQKSGNYTSIEVMVSLCWARFRRHLGAKNKGKTIFVVDLQSSIAGLGDLVKSALSYSAVVRERGWIPVINLTNTQYSDDPEENLWEKLFEPVDSVDLEEALRSDDVILGRDNSSSRNEIGIEFQWNPYCAEHFMELTPLFLSKSVYDRFMQLKSPKIVATKTIGVLARGTDLAAIFNYDCNWYEDAKRVKQFQKELSYQSVFLATEELECLKAFQTIIGEDLLYIEQTRISHIDASQKNHVLYKLLEHPQGARSAFGERYLFIIWCLSKCGIILYNIQAGALFVALCLRLAEIGQEGEYRPIHEVPLFDDSRKKKL